MHLTIAQQVVAATRSGDDLLGYCEVHIEQGPVLEARDLPVGVVSAIAGQSRIAVVLTGVAGHAGTVPMDLRQDAFAPPLSWCWRSRRWRAIRRAGGHRRAARGAAGCQQCHPWPITLSLDVRHQDDARREQALAELRQRAEQIAGARGIALDWRIVQESCALAATQH